MFEINLEDDRDPLPQAPKQRSQHFKEIIQEALSYPIREESMDILISTLIEAGLMEKFVQKINFAQWITCFIPNTRSSTNVYVTTNNCTYKGNLPSQLK